MGSKAEQHPLSSRFLFKLWRHSDQLLFYYGKIPWPRQLTDELIWGYGSRGLESMAELNPSATGRAESLHLKPQGRQRALIQNHKSSETSEPSFSNTLPPSRFRLLILQNRQLGIKYSYAQDLLGTSYSKHQSLTLVILASKPHFSWEVSILIVLSEPLLAAYPRSSI